MQARFVLVLATILGSHLTNATYHLRAALVTAAPRLNELNARQNLQCQHATETVCADGNGCCPFGEACTVYKGAPACVGTCGSNAPICPNELCCRLGKKCVLSAGSYYCSDAAAVIPTFTLPTFTVPKITKTIATVTPFIITLATEPFPTVTLPTETFPTETFPTATVTVSNTFTRSSGSSSDSSSSSAAMTETTSPSSESVDSSSSAAVPPTTFIPSGEAPAASEPWFAIVLTWFTGLLLMA